MWLREGIKIAPVHCIFVIFVFRCLSNEQSFLFCFVFCFSIFEWLLYSLFDSKYFCKFLLTNFANRKKVCSTIEAMSYWNVTLFWSSRFPRLQISSGLRALFGLSGARWNKKVQLFVGVKKYELFSSSRFMYFEWLPFCIEQFSKWSSISIGFWNDYYFPIDESSRFGWQENINFLFFQKIIFIKLKVFRKDFVQKCCKNSKLFFTYCNNDFEIFHERQ